MNFTELDSNSFYKLTRLNIQGALNFINNLLPVLCPPKKKPQGLSPVFYYSHGLGKEATGSN